MNTSDIEQAKLDEMLRCCFDMSEQPSMRLTSIGFELALASLFKGMDSGQSGAAG
jgi:hypothetical protein